MKDLTETEKALRALRDMIDSGLNAGDEKKTGFALLVFDFNCPSIASYISNGKREDMIEAMAETVVRLKIAEDIPGRIDGIA